MIRAVVTDDERASAELLVSLLEGTGKIEIVGVAHSGAECLKVVGQAKPEVLFLDIRMPGMSGIEVAETLVHSGFVPLIVFVTDHDEYAVKAFELAAVDYIVKALDLDTFEERIEEAVDRAEAALRVEQPALASLQKSLTELMQHQQLAVSRRLPVKDYEEGTVRLIEPSTITHVEREGAHVVVHTAAASFRTYHTIDRLEERLKSAGFFRANRAALINVSYVQHLIPNGDGTYDAMLDAQGTKVISVSRSRAKALLEALGV